MTLPTGDKEVFKKDERSGIEESVFNVFISAGFDNSLDGLERKARTKSQAQIRTKIIKPTKIIKRLYWIFRFM
ncbi:hypothetical protein [Dubosiella newyorkensis]|uniref:hypothetical protein n=1 Tax=Dubosiella newyorkensis TaxID=1862672 RepID=UPI00272D5EBC|nr:hypothetical protein [Dubosiella newyorkensis]